MKQNKDKRGIWHFTSAITLAVIALALGSCTKEPLTASNRNDMAQVRITLPTNVRSGVKAKAEEIGSTNESRLDNITVFVFNIAGKLETLLTEDLTAASLTETQPKWKSDNILLVPIIKYNEPKNIYAVANWNKTEFNKNTYTESSLKSEVKSMVDVLTINGSKAYPMIMSGGKAGVNLMSSLFSVTLNIARQVAKIRAKLTLSAVTQNRMPDVIWLIDEMTITVGNVPTMSYIIANNTIPYGVVMLNSTPFSLNDKEDTKPKNTDQTYPVATNNLIWVKDRIYINENLVNESDKTTATYIVIQLPYQNRKTGFREGDNYYKLYINNKDDDAAPHTVLRNTIYDFNISILGLGSPFNDMISDVNIDNIVTVSDWGYGGIGDVEIPRNYFNIDRSHLEFQSSETQLQSVVVTDVANWELVSANGITILSFAKSMTTATVDGITYTLSGNNSVATVTVNRGLMVNFTTQKMFFIAKNLKMPFTVAYKP